MKTKKIDDTCVEAIEDLRKNIGQEYKKTYGCNRDIHFTEASRILGMKYFQLHFGKMPIEEIDKILKLGRKRL